MIRFIQIAVLLSLCFCALSAQTVYTSIEEALQQKETARILHIPSSASVSVADWREIARLEMLQELRISSKRMIYIPDLIERLDSLRVLEINTNQDIKWPEEAMSRLQSLRVLKLNNCLGPDLPGFLSNLIRLEELELSDRDTEDVPDGLGQLKNLKKLSLNLPLMPDWPEGLWELDQLQEVTIVSGKLQELTLPVGAMPWNNLRELSLHLGEVESLPSEMLPPSLERLHLECPNVRAWPGSLSELTAISELNLYGGEQTEPIPDLSKMKQLEKAIFFYARMSSKTAGIEHCPLLRELRLYRSDLSNFKLKALKSKSLEVLGLHHCSGVNDKHINAGMSVKMLVIQDDQTDRLPPKIHQLKNLENLDVSGKKLATLGKVWQNPALKVLSIARTNALRALPELRESEGSGLEELHIWADNLTVLPDSYGELTGLKRLTLRARAWESLPESLGNLRGLTDLVLEGAHREDLPESLGRLEALKNVLMYVDPNLSEEKRDELEACFPQARVSFRNQLPR